MKLVVFTRKGKTKEVSIPKNASSGEIHAILERVALVKGNWDANVSKAVVVAESDEDKEGNQWFANGDWVILDRS